MLPRNSVSSPSWCMCWCNAHCISASHCKTAIKCAVRNAHTGLQAPAQEQHMLDAVSPGLFQCPSDTGEGGSVRRGGAEWGECSDGMDGPYLPSRA